MNDILTVAPPINPPFLEYHHHGDHAPSELGDYGAVDLMPIELSNGVYAQFRGDGLANEDWFGWNKSVYSTVDGVVVELRNEVSINTPGQIPEAMLKTLGYIVIETCDGIYHLFCHIRLISGIKLGDRIKRRDVIGYISNNGRSRCPHLHYGAWRNNVPLILAIIQTNEK